jgi:hypothetical protein
MVLAQDSGFMMALKKEFFSLASAVQQQPELDLSLDK